MLVSFIYQLLPQKELVVFYADYFRRYDSRSKSQEVLPKLKSVYLGVFSLSVLRRIGWVN